MKTAEEWMGVIKDKLPFGADNCCLKVFSLGEIKSIQQDAIIEGMKRAAEICNRRYNGNEVINATYLAGESFDCAKAILAAAQELEKEKK